MLLSFATAPPFTKSLQIQFSSFFLKCLTYGSLMSLWWYPPFDSVTLVYARALYKLTVLSLLFFIIPFAVGGPLSIVLYVHLNFLLSVYTSWEQLIFIQTEVPQSSSQTNIWSLRVVIWVWFILWEDFKLLILYIFIKSRIFGSLSD